MQIKKINLENLEKRAHRKEIINIIIGVVLISLGIHLFLAPNNLTLGGGAGLAIVLSSIFPISTGPMLVIINIVLFIIGFVFLGPAFGKRTIIASLGLSLLVWALDVFFPIEKPIVDNLFVQLVACVLMYGTGVAIVLNNYASTGGSDIFAKILQKYIGLDLGKGCLIADFAITVFAWYQFGTEIALYSLVGVVLNGTIIDNTINGLNTSKLCFINTSKPKEVCKFLTEHLTRSANVYKAIGAYTGLEKEVVQTVVSNRDYIVLKRYIKELDPLAFIVAASASETLGWRWRSIIR
ncbi:YitT family protein [Lagierella sp.]|uniref:YitT family protein n=1 Tax=Lagierella sp. TaxID=2849657 RepID=UPI0026217CB0|nr:YitT family protein [Lagierella sp.]